MDILKHHQEQQQTIPSHSNIVLRWISRQEKYECPIGHQSHRQCCNHGPFDHHPIKDRLLWIPRLAIQHISFVGFESQRDILDPIGHQIEPEQLHWQERQIRQPGTDSKGH